MVAYCYTEPVDTAPKVVQVSQVYVSISQLYQHPGALYMSQSGGGGGGLGGVPGQVDMVRCSLSIEDWA